MARHLDAGADPKTHPFLSLPTHAYIVPYPIQLSPAASVYPTDHSPLFQELHGVYGLTAYPCTRSFTPHGTS